ncbi:RNA polymerase sigma factor (sigma-70 family) [Allocatelliglobosispora scoriae]|uniref:RNA polymerase sigma factor (Sigma-70 family) n=1 Tax=Allocatelliglobosispora scoriae TaxID=643052 RepID=A0A841BNK9_9ACTN|nr:sigma-70 family RNA polymerase sigma factor [Allocatelliglobosispora scoriae]MBB5869265.1 RNA polymerase sigma factor (sigma-70 family) [Allocatelliglobosispora scoriae]
MRQRAPGDVYTREYPGLVRLAYVTTGSLAAAEDVVQDVFADWFRLDGTRRDEVREPAAYLRRAVLSRCTSWVRRRIVERKHAAVPALAPPSPDVPVQADIAAVRAALRHLAPRQRAAVFLRYYLDLPEAQIAAELACRPGTVKSLLHRSLATMKEVLGD